MIEAVELGARVVEAAAFERRQPELEPGEQLTKREARCPRLRQPVARDGDGLGGVARLAQQPGTQGLEQALPLTVFVASGISQTVVADLFGLTPVPTEQGRPHAVELCDEQAEGVAPAPCQFGAFSGRALRPFVVGAQ